MPRTGRMILPRRRWRLTFDPLERRDLPTSGLPAYLAATGFGVVGKNSAIHADAVATDAAGNAVVTGSFRGTVTFSPTASGATFTSSNTQDAFVARYSSAGTLIWARTFAGQATTAATGTTDAVGEGSGVAVDGTGNIFVAGTFTGTVNFGSAAAPNFLASPSHTAAFVTRLDPAGNLVWVRTAVASGGDDQANGLALDGRGGVVVAGMFEQAVGFGATTLTSVGSSDAFVARYDGAGNLVWATGSQGTTGSNAQAIGVAVDPSGNVAVTGFDAGTVGLGSGSSVVRVTSAGSDDALIWKLDATGKLLWARSFGSTDYDTGGGVAFDPAGDVVVVGTFSGTVNFATSGPPATLTAGPIFDVFVLKLDPTGQGIWGRSYVGGTGWAKGQAVAVDPFGQVHVAGAFTGAVDFDPNAGTDTLTSVGSTDAFAAGLDAGGNFVYALQAGQTNFNTVLGIAVNAAGAVAIAGTYTGSVAFGPIAVPSAGSASSFVARYQTQPTPSPSPPMLEAASLTGTNNTTSITTPTFDLTVTDPAAVLRLFRDGAVVAQRVGTGALTDPGPVSQGSHQYAAVAVSPAGIASAPSLPITVTILTTPPVAPTALALLAADDSGYLGDGITNVRTPRITGKATAGLTVQILTASGAVLGAAVAASDGTFTVKLGALADAAYPLQAVALDAAANRSAASSPLTLTILTVPPASPPAPSLLPADDSGIKGDGLTNVRAPRLTVTDGPGLLMFLFNAVGSVIGSVTTATNGVYTVPIAASLADGTYPIRAAAMDAAGNLSSLGSSFTLTILTATPARLAAPTLASADDTGVKGDALTTVRRPRVSGTATPGGEVDWIAADGSLVGATIAGASGSYLVQPFAALPNGTVAVQVRQVDQAGNVGPTGPSFSLTIRAATGDYFGDSKTDFAVYRPSTTVFYVWNSTLGQISARAFGAVGDVPIAGDFVGDGVGDLATYRPSTGLFSLFDPSTGATSAQIWGNVGDVPVPGDYDADGRTDLAVFRPSTATFYVQLSATGASWYEQWGTAGDIPIPGDYFGNGHTDVAVFRPSNDTFYINDPITGAVKVQTWGLPGDIPVPADFDGDGKTDLAVFRPSTDTFYVIQSSTNTVIGRQWGISGDVPVTGSYFGNGRASFAVYRPSTSTFYALDPVTSAVLAMQFGVAGDKPIQPSITTNFNFGMPPKGSAIVAPILGPAPTPAAVDFVPVVAASAPIVPPSSSTVARSLSTVDQALASLGLERWRVG